MQEFISNYIASNWIEIVGSILSLIYLYLSVKQKISLWIFGFLCSAFYIIIFYQSKFYADMTLQVYYLVVSVYGWFNWKRTDKDSSDQKNTILITKVSGTLAVYLTIASVLIFAVYYWTLTNYTDSPLPIGDSVTTALSIVATWMLARKLIEYWLVFIFVDALSSGLYFYKELYPTAILFIVYTIMAIIGYFQWLKTYKQQPKTENN